MDRISTQSPSPTELLTTAMIQQLLHRSALQCQVTLPAIPTLIDTYLDIGIKLVAQVGGKLSNEERAAFRRELMIELARAYSASPRSKVSMSFEVLSGSATRYQVAAHVATLEDCYAQWITSREPPLFGSEPDARVWSLANELAEPAAHWVLDIGAGTGRNALPLARRGHPVDAVEITPAFAEMIATDAKGESLNVRVLTRDIFTPTNDLRDDYQLIVASEVVSDFRTTRQLRALLELAACRLLPGARLVFNVFVARDGYVPNIAARELGQSIYTSIFTNREISFAASGLPLNLISDDSVYDYEKTYLPDGAWPQTNWYARWVSGWNVFPVERDLSPIEMRWLVFEKS